MPAMLVLLVTGIGTLGYYWLGRDQQATLLDALYMTIITITTIGYGEVIRLNAAGRLFTIVIAITGIGSLFYSLTVVMEYLVSSHFVDPFGKRKRQRDIRQLKHHVILAGLGRVGRQAAMELQESRRQFVIIDPSPEAEHYAIQHHYPVIVGDATDDAILELAGIRQAHGLIVTTNNDASNLYIVLSARALQPDLYIVARAFEDKSIPKLLRAGANRAISPYTIGGRRLAHLMLSPTVVDFFDTVIKRGEESLNLEGIKVHTGSGVIGRSLADVDIRAQTGASILVLLRDKRVMPNPDPAWVLQADDELLALGTLAQLDTLERLVSDHSGMRGQG